MNTHERSGLGHEVASAFAPGALVVLALTGLIVVLPDGTWIERVLEGLQAVAAVIATVLALRAIRDSSETAQILADSREAEREAAARLVDVSGLLKSLLVDARRSRLTQHRAAL